MLLLAGLALLAGPSISRVGGWLVLGFVYASLHTWATHEELPSALEGVDLHVQGIVTGLPESDEGKQRFFLKLARVSRVDADSIEPHSSWLVRLNWYGQDAPIIASGQQLDLVVKLKRARGFSNPGGFDYEKWLFIRRIVATGYVRERQFDPSTAIVRKATGWRLETWRNQLRQRLRAATQGLRNSGVMLALAMGDRSGIDQLQWQRYIDTGTNHLLAISGLHISLIAGFAGWLGAALWGRYRRARQFTRNSCAAVAGLLAALCYAAMAGFALPTQRALIMLTVLAAALLWARHLRRSAGFALALIAVCLWDPRAALGVGLWLSFAAVAILMLVFSGERRARAHNRALALLRSHVLITIGLAPLTLLLFGRMSLVAPLANLVAVPLVGFIVVPLVFVSSLLATVSVTAAGLLFQLLDQLLSWLSLLLDWLAALPLAVLSRGSFSIWQLAFACAAVALSLLPQFWRLRWLLIPLLIPALFGGSVQRPPEGEFEAIFLDIGQGTAVVVLTRRHALVYDTGAGYSDRFNGASIAILPLLKSRQVTRVDKLVLSHPDHDHTGGAAHLIDEIAVATIVGSAPVAGLPVEIDDCTATLAWAWDGVQFEFLAPQHDQQGSENDRSCVLAIRSASGASALLPGDIERDGERLLLATRQTPVQLLMAPHHGSKTSSSERFVRVFQPEHVVYTTGYANRYGFPNSLVRDRYREIQAREHNTAIDGAISFASGQGSFSWHNQRQLQRRIWNRPGQKAD